MKTKHLFWGFLFITLGILILLNNFTDINFYWLGFWKFWPVFLILLGIALLIKQEAVRAILISLAAVAIAVAIFSTFKFGFNFFRHDFIFDLKNDIDNDSYETEFFEEDFNQNVNFASVYFEGGAGSFKIKDTTSKLFSAVTTGNNHVYDLITYEEGENVKINFSQRSERVFSFKKKNKVDIKLNTNPTWKLNFALGAAAGEFDLRNYKVEDLDIDIGAASLKIILGSLLDSAKVDIDAGASSIEISIPENAGCEVNATVLLASRKLEGFNKYKDRIYRTDNFETADKKIYMTIDAGVSSVRVKRYASDDW